MALTDNLQAFYKLSDLSDSSGNNRTLTNNGNVTFASGKIGNAAVFDGSNYLTNSVNISNYSGLTIAMWIKETESGKIFFGIPSQNEANIYISNHVGNIACSFQSGFDITDSFNLADGEWHHVVSSLDSNNSIRLYADGNLLQLVENTNAVLSNSGNVGYIGAWEGSYGASTGSIDAVGIWNRALSDAEVAELYNNGTGIELESSGGGGGGNPTLVKMQAPVKFFGKVKFGV
jgi:arabinan endo-1,5-alpha-L-arabinosidase